MHDIVDVDYHLAGFERELVDGLARLQATDGADDHVTWYRDRFQTAVRTLRQTLARVGPPGAEIAVQAWQVAFLAHIWPTLKDLRGRETGRDVLGTHNQDQVLRARVQRLRCLELAQTMARPTAEQIQRRYRTTYPLEPTPAARTIRRYLASQK